MDGEDINALKVKLDFLTGMIRDIQGNVKELKKQQEEVIRLCEWRINHTQDHDRISKQLGRLPALELKVARLGNGYKKNSAIAGGGIAAAIVALKELFTYFLS